MPPINITPNLNATSLESTLTKTQPAAVITSDLATNITNTNLEMLAKEEQEIQTRLEQDRLMKVEKERELVKQQAKAPSAIDKAISDTIGAKENVPTPEEMEKQEKIKRRKNISTQIANIARQVDPFSAQILNNIETLISTQD